MVETELKTDLRRNDITLKQVAVELKRPYSTVVSWLNGFSPLPSRVRREIMNMIAERKKYEKK